MPKCPVKIFYVIKGFLKILIVILLGSLVVDVTAQDKCATDEYNQKFYKEGRKLDPARFNKWLLTLPSKRALSSSRTAAEPALIPVVVHVIHNGEPLGSGVNISEAQIQSQIDVLNEDYRRLNADTTDTPAEFKPVASFLDIEFVLARRDPVGNPTNGIVRKQGSKTVWGPVSDDSALKAESYWPAEDYFNLWVCDLTGENLGYAQYPDAVLPGLESVNKKNRLTDGVVLDYRVCGSSDKGNFPDLRVPYDKGRTGSHEVGHWLGLIHNFATPGNCLDDDFVDDTPLQQSSYNGDCPTHPVSSCSSVDMFQNYMDYTADDCMNIFTQGQTNRMQLVLDNAPRRTSLLNGQGAFPPNVDYNDLALIQVNSPAVISCYTTVEPTITIQNLGTNPITAIELTYGMIGSQMNNILLTIDSLKSGQQRLITLPSFTVVPGDYYFYCEVDISGSVDFNLENNSETIYTIIDNRIEEVPFIEKFEFDNLAESNWNIFNPDNDISWQVDQFSNYQSALIKLYNYDKIGQEDWLISPVFDYSFAESASLRFKVSYAINEGFKDKLTVYISNDCGNSFQQIYSDDGPAISVENTADYWQPSNDSDWKTITLNISEYAGSEAVRIAFVTTNGFGNNLYIDDVELFIQSVQDIINIPEGEIALFPSPTKGPLFNIGIKTSEKEDVVLQVFSSNGQKVLEQTLRETLNQVYQCDLTGQSEGVYIVKVTGNTINAVDKIIFRP